jgi:hypothetical protein
LHQALKYSAGPCGRFRARRACCAPGPRPAA